jgi:hypothetical protein
VLIGTNDIMASVFPRISVDSLCRLKSCVFVIMLCSSVFRPQCFADNFGQKFSDSFGRFECGSSYV